MYCFKLYYDTKVRAATAILATFSTAVFGYGIVGILRPLTVYPSEMVYWLVCPMHSRVYYIELNHLQNLPTVSVFQGIAYSPLSGVNLHLSTRAAP